MPKWVTRSKCRAFTVRGHGTFFGNVLLPHAEGLRGTNPVGVVCRSNDFVLIVGADGVLLTNSIRRQGGLLRFKVIVVALCNW